MNPNRILSTIGMKCPKPLFEVHRNMKAMAEGEVLEVAADDPAFKLDIKAWCNRTGNELVELRDESPRLVAIIRKV